MRGGAEGLNRPTCLLLLLSGLHPSPCSAERGAASVAAAPALPPLPEAPPPPPAPTHLAPVISVSGLSDPAGHQACHPRWYYIADGMTRRTLGSTGGAIVRSRSHLQVAVLVLRGLQGAALSGFQRPLVLRHLPCEGCHLADRFRL
eukprot:6550257-Pyramimonas_sp.AAC.2